jgi:hypothetical protein
MKQRRNVAAEWLAILLRIREIPRLDLGLESGYPDWSLLENYAKDMINILI